ncbi:MAG: hypothetical protein PHH26_02905, partial [Candidatus Thermoplasmatota archaeon]|nr:hypothetical protein [Candidatus Thermoplasmatota archaeon]
MGGNKKTMLAGIFALMFILCAFAPSAMAGSAADPEITDAAGDVKTTPGDQGVPAQISGDFDIVSGWFSEETATTFNAHLKVASMSQATLLLATGPLVCDIYFTIGSASYYAQFTGTAGIYNLPPTADLPTFTFKLYYSNGTSLASLNGSVDTATGNITMTIPKDKVGSPAPGSIMTDCYAVSRGNLDMGLGLTPIPVGVYDRAPDADYGRPYIFGGAGPNAGNINITLVPTALTATKGQTKSAIITIRNNGTA